MTAPGWLPDGATLHLADPALRPLGQLFSVVAPGVTTLPVVVERVTGDPGSPRSWTGTGALWGSPDARFGLSADAADAPTSAWVAVRVELLAGLAPPGFEPEALWLVLAATGPAAAARPWPARRHAFGAVRVAGRRVLVRLAELGSALTASVAFDGALGDVEQAVLGHASAPFEDLRFSHLSGLYGNDGDPHADLDALPEQLRTPAVFDLRELHLTIDPQDDRVLTGIGAVVGFLDGLRWPLIPGFDGLTLGDVRLGLDVDHPLDPAVRFPRIGARGTIGLGSASVAVTARWPDLSVTGTLRDGLHHPIRPGELLAAAHLPDLGGPVDITELTFAAHPTATPVTFTLHARAVDVLAIPVGGSALEVRDLEVDLDLAGGADRALAVDLRGTLMLGTHGLMLRAAGDHGATGWTLQATLVGEPIDLTALEAWVTERFGGHPLPRGAIGTPPTATGPQVTRLDVEYHTASGDARLDIGTDLALGSVTGDLDLRLDLAHHGAGGYASTVAGTFHVGEHAFDLVLARDAAAGAPQVLVGTYRNTAGAAFGDLLEALGLPGIRVTPTDAVLARVDDGSLALVDMGVGVDLSALPLVGRMLPPGETLALALRAVAATGGWDADRLAALAAHLPPGIAVPALPDGGTTLPPAGLVVALNLGGETLHLDVGLALDAAAATAPRPAGAPTPPLPVQPTGGGSNAGWQPVQRAFGPVHLRRVSAHYADRAVTLLLDGDLVLGGLTLSLLGLSASVGLDASDPHFTLDGLGLDVRQEGLELGGALLRLGENSFAGVALLRTPALSLSAVGAYEEVDGHTSLFVYAVLDYPLGGPAFFFVTGLAAGFGYNRRLVLPGVADVATFPLVREATQGAAPPDRSSLADRLRSFTDVLPPSPGALFAAAGLRFTSFKTVDSFALLTVSLDPRLRIDLLGSSTLVAPAPVPGAAPVPPVAVVHMGFRAQFVPEEGFLGLDAQLTAASYLLSERCHLTGGAAFHTWLAGPLAGDFVVTVGGYHPLFRAPDHYPVVPRVGIEWQVTDEVEIKGDLYYALTGHAIMAGGHLEATYTSGAVSAWFRTGADLLATWQPFAYDAHAYADAGVRWHGFTFELGVDVHVWGPEFAGVAEVHLWITSFTVHFGDTSAPALDPVGWDAFRTASLPGAVCTVACTRGLLARVEADPGQPEWVVSAHDLVLTVGSQVPATAATLNGGPLGAPAAPVGVAPMDVAVGGLDAPLTVTVERGGNSVDLRATPVHRPAPAALWGARPAGWRPDPNAPAHVDDTLAGFELRPPTRPVPSSSRAVRLADLADDPMPATAAGPADRIGFAVPAQPGPDPAARAAAMAALLRGLGIDPAEVRPGADRPEPVSADIVVQGSGR